MSSIPKHFTVWMVNDASCLDQPFMDVTVLEDELVGADPDKDGSWSSKGDPVFYGVTTVNAKEGDAQDGCDQADDLMREAGWERVGAWDTTDNSYIATVERT